MGTIEQSLQLVRERISAAESRFGRNRGDVKLIAVSKTMPAELLLEAREAGQIRFGESYLQEALEKWRALEGKGLEWHFVGPLQSNKTRPVAAHFDWVHSVDRIKLAHRLNEQRPDELPPLNLCLQVNISGEESKSGVMLNGLKELAFEVQELPRLKLRGLMCIPAPAHGLEAQREPFRRVREALEALQAEGLSLDSLSMGMSSDLEAAVAEGATMVRIGTAIFGPRQKRA